ncbi:hypothetical protein ONA91_39270 [Micromonospora sp. DR5-3]|uniref:hypothetical protein n=1 Tax=unclassified Micromonospora TaxID=2617518 RepID=UPI001652827C|nr:MULTISPECIES: hypothetical protein [unclassified Micromonospora]MCW3820490.1 hypothetical protein [Micromonospora sp. DR5-3]
MTAAATTRSARRRRIRKDRRGHALLGGQALDQRVAEAGRADQVGGLVFCPGWHRWLPARTARNHRRELCREDAAEVVTAVV